MFKHSFFRTLTLFTFSTLAACAAIGTAVSHRHLETQTLMSHSIFLPAGETRQNKTIFIEVRNTTDKTIDLEPELKQALRAQGYQLVPQPAKAHFVLQINLLQMGKNSESAAKEMLGSGYGGELEGAIAGGALAYVTNSMSPVSGGLIGGTATTVADNLVQNVTFTGIVDVRLKINTTKTQPYQTRILVMANQVNLDFAKALPKIKEGLVRSISGLLA